MPDPKREARNLRVRQAYDELTAAEKDLTDNPSPVPPEPDHVPDRLDVAIENLRTELSASWKGIADTLRDLAAAHAGTIGDHTSDLAKMTREAIGQHRLTTEATINQLRLGVQDGCKVIAQAIREAAQTGHKDPHDLDRNAR